MGMEYNLYKACHIVLSNLKNRSKRKGVEVRLNVPPEIHALVKDIQTFILRTQGKYINLKDIYISILKHFEMSVSLDGGPDASKD